MVLSWRAAVPESATNKGDLTYVEIVTESGVAARCAFDDQGRGSLPGSLLKDIRHAIPQEESAGAEPLLATLAMHRVRQGSFHVTGVDVGEVRFDMSVTASVVLRTAPSERAF